MQIQSYTPFPHLVFEAEDVSRAPFTVLAVHGTFEIERGRPLRPIQEQVGLCYADEYRGDPLLTSVRVEGDLAAFKPRSDIHIEAIAHAPSGRAERDWLVGARVGNVTKILRVTGPRAFERGILGWRLTDPEPCAAVPIVYERAFGGTWRHGDDEVAFEQNPVGVGFVPREVLRPYPNDAPRRIDAPQIESPDDPITGIGNSYAPQGFGPTRRAWLPRRALAGTFDARWLERRWPALPEDFSFAYHNSAHPDMIYPNYLNGDEPVVLEGLDPGGRLSFTLPGYRLGATIRYDDASSHRVACVLDTLRIDVPARRAFLTWRARAWVPKPDCAVRAVVVRMQFSDGTTPQMRAARAHG